MLQCYKRNTDGSVASDRKDSDRISEVGFRSKLLSELGFRSNIVCLKW